MTRSRRLLVMLIAAMLIMAIPGTAFAAKKSKGGKYVPTKGVKYDLEDGKWVANKETVEAVFDKSGKVRSVQYKGEGWSRNYTYVWKGENLRTYIYNEAYTNSTYTENTEYSIKKKKPSRFVRTYTSVYEGETESGSTEAVYRWGKKDGSVTYSYRNKNNVETSRNADVISLKKGKRAFVWQSNTSYTYYKNGLLKSISSPNLDGTGSDYTEYDQYGYPVKEENSWTDEDDGPQWNKTTYTWAYDAKTKCPTEVVVSYTTNGGYSDTYKWVFSDPLKVKKVRNCDAFGNQVWLGV